MESRTSRAAATMCSRAGQTSSGAGSRGLHPPRGASASGPAPREPRNNRTPQERPLYWLSPARCEADDRGSPSLGVGVSHEVAGEAQVERALQVAIEVIGRDAILERP